jgi:hypothetical protein
LITDLFNRESKNEFSPSLVPFTIAITIELWLELERGRGMMMAREGKLREGEITSRRGEERRGRRKTELVEEGSAGEKVQEGTLTLEERQGK